MYFVKAPESGRVESSDDGRTVADTAGLEDAVLHLDAFFGRHALITRARGLPAKNQRKWVAETLKKNDDWRCTLLVIDPNEIVPLHDHPGACGIHLVLSGGARHYQFSVVGQSHGAWMLNRESLVENFLNRSILVSFSTERGNAHSFIAGDEGCVLLNISHRSSHLGHWYYPVNHIASQTVVAVRLERQPH